MDSEAESPPSRVLQSRDAQERDLEKAIPFFFFFFGSTIYIPVYTNTVRSRKRSKVYLKKKRRLARMREEALARGRVVLV